MSDLRPGGLLVRAKRLTTLARQAREGAEAVQDHTRTETALAKLEASLNELESAVTLQSEMVRRAIGDVKQLDLKKPPQDLKNHLASVGRPSPQLLQARANDAGKAVRVISDAAGAAWATWARQQIDGLPVDRLARLGFDRGSIELRLDTLKRLAATPPTVGNIDNFVSTFELVQARLEKVQPEGPLDAVLAKLPCHLDDLTDDELGLLRVEHPDVAAQIFLRIE